MTHNMNTVSDLLERIAIALEARNQPALQEGFFDYGKKVFANIVQGNGDGWYTLTDGVATTLKPVVRGRVAALRFPTVERRNQEVRKFHLLLSVDDEVVTFESGYSCFFSKSVLAALAATPPEVLTAPIQIASYPKRLNTGDTTLAVSIRDSNGNQLPCEWTNDDDWRAISRTAIANVNAAVLSRQ